MQTRSAAVVLGLLALVVPVRVRAADDTVSVTPHWKKGEKFQYEKIKTREMADGDRVIQNMTARSVLEVEVVSTGADATVLAWTAGEARFDDPEQAANPLVQRLGNMLKNARALLELDEDWRITGVKNWKALQQTSFKGRDALVEEVRDSGAEKELVDQIAAQVTSMIDTKEKVEDLVGGGEAQLFLLPLGLSLPESEPLVMDGALPNVLGGQPIPARAKFEIKSYDRTSGRATIVYTQTVDPKDAQRIMEETAKDIAEKTGRPGPDPKEFAGMVFEDRAEYVVDIPSGWVQEFTHHRTMKSGARRQQDTVTIRRTNADATP
ncbi:MAG TPA: hypothetical protein VGR62_00700 [Candidatus Binatia bacterium]|nr:hypothetical protein [Candidatus Binatia bacterium]